MPVVTAQAIVNVAGREGLATWHEVALGPGVYPTMRRVVRPHSTQYPNATGVSLWHNGVFNRTDPTGVRQGSEYHFYNPTPTLVAGDVLRAKWIDERGIARISEHVAGTTNGGVMTFIQNIDVRIGPVGDRLPQDYVRIATDSLGISDSLSISAGEVNLPDPGTPIGTALEEGGLLVGYPSLSNTGCRIAENDLTVHNGDYVMTAGEHLSGYKILGNLKPKANCTATDCIIYFNHNYGVDVRVSSAGGSISLANRPVISYCTIDGTNGTPAHSPLYGEGNPYKLSYCKIINFGAPPFMTSNQEISDCFIESYRYESGLHKEAIFHNGGTNNQILRNTLIGNGSGTSAALALYGEVSPGVTNMLVDGNVMACSQGYTTYTGSLSYKPFPNGVNVDYIGNHFMELWHYNQLWNISGQVTGSTTNGDWTGNVIHNGPNAGQPVS